MTIEEMKNRKKELGYSCEQLSQLSGVPLGTVQKLFSGITRSPRRSTVAALEAVLKKRNGRYDMPDQNGRYMMVSDVAVEYGVSDKVPEKRDKNNEKSISDDVKSGVWSRQGTYTVDDYLELPDDIRVELIDGVLYEMHAPTAVHQIISMELSAELHDHIKKNHGKCRVFTAPFDIQLNKDDKTMVQPDILVICKRSGYTAERGIGAPDLVIEILSRSTRSRDMLLKLNKYADAGVREYWIIDPDDRKIIVYYFEDDSLSGIYDFNEKIPVRIWNGSCVIDFSMINKEIDAAEEEMNR